MKHVYEGRLYFRYAGRGVELVDVPDDEPSDLGRWLAEKLLPGEDAIYFSGEARVRIAVTVLDAPNRAAGRDSAHAGAQEVV